MNTSDIQTNRYSTGKSRWQAFTWYHPRYSDEPYICTTYGWTKGQARRRMKRLISRIASSDGRVSNGHSAPRVLR